MDKWVVDLKKKAEEILDVVILFAELYHDGNEVSWHNDDEKALREWSNCIPDFQSWKIFLQT
jgi:hypothetical protein